MSNFKGINGTPWHIETIGMDEDDKRRHRSRCVYFERSNIHCYKMKGKCIGSAHCDFYKEKPSESNREEAVLEEKKQKPKILVDKQRLDEQSDQLGVLVGEKIAHTFYGVGEVVSIDNGIVRIKFDDDLIRKFSIKSCIEKGLLKILDNKDETFSDKPETVDVIEETLIKKEYVQEDMDVLNEQREHPDSKTLFKYIITAIVAFIIAISLLVFVNNQYIIKIIGVALILLSLVLLAAGLINFFKKKEKSQEDSK